MLNHSIFNYILQKVTNNDEPTNAAEENRNNITTMRGTKKFKLKWMMSDIISM